MGRAVERALARLSAPGAILAVDRSGRGFSVYANGDRRRRPLARLSLAEIRLLESEGALTTANGAYVLSAAGRARVLRAEASASEQYLAQHGSLVSRHVMNVDGVRQAVRGRDPDGALRRLGVLRDADGRPWLDPAEMRAAARLRHDWLMGQVGLVRGSDWEAPPRSGAARGPANSAEHAAGAQCDARQRVEEALGALAPLLRRTIEAICLQERGIEALERAERWPARSGKIALKLGLAQLAARFG